MVDQTFVGCHISGDFLGNFPFIEAVVTALCDLSQCPGEILLHQQVAELIRFSVLRKDGLSGLVAQKSFV